MSREDQYGSYGVTSLQQKGIGLIVALVVGLIAVGSFAAKGCQDGPFGRKQIVTMSNEQEVALGLQAYKEVLSDPKTVVINSGRAAQLVQEVTSRLAAATEDPAFLKMARLKDRKYLWETKLVNSKEVNAFCLPGGKMVMFTGILPVCQTDAGLAVVMGHELSHALGRHGAERMAHSQMAQIGIAAAGSSMGGVTDAERQRVMQILNAGAKFGIMSYGRRHESEADHLGLLLMATAGYDPAEAPKFWERMTRATGSGSKTPEFMSTHPSHETRIRDLTNWLPEAEPLYKGSRFKGEKPKPIN
ncbi:MAG: M48 family peptidase [Planctomycetia bacterium]|nr:M48 family peptidase [Planctomycetia bacterium]